MTILTTIDYFIGVYETEYNKRPTKLILGFKLAQKLAYLVGWTAWSGEYDIADGITLSVDPTKEFSIEVC